MLWLASIVYSHRLTFLKKCSTVTYEMPPVSCITHLVFRFYGLKHCLPFTVVPVSAPNMGTLIRCPLTWWSQPFWELKPKIDSFSLCGQCFMLYILSMTLLDQKDFPWTVHIETAYTSLTTRSTTAKEAELRKEVTYQPGAWLCECEITSKNSTSAGNRG